MFYNMFYDASGTQKYCLSCMLDIEQKIVDIVRSEYEKNFVYVESQVEKTIAATPKRIRYRVRNENNFATFNSFWKKFCGSFGRGQFVNKGTSSKNKLNKTKLTEKNDNFVNDAKDNADTNKTVPTEEKKSEIKLVSSAEDRGGCHRQTEKSASQTVTQNTLLKRNLDVIERSLRHLPQDTSPRSRRSYSRKCYNKLLETPCPSVLDLKMDASRLPETYKSAVEKINSKY